MKALEINFREFITAGYRTFSIPVYQRNYEWREKECTKLFEDIEAMVGKDKNHFVGTIVYVTGTSNATWNEFSIIDGQQRICSTMLLLKAIHDVTTDDSTKAEIWEDYLTNKRATDEKYRLKLKPIENDESAWVNVMDGTGVTNTESNLWKNYTSFIKLINQSQFSPQELFEAIGRLEIVYIQLEAGKENPQIIFESINSTGMSLTTGDLIRNFLLMNCPEQRIQTSLYKNYWVKIEKYCTSAVIPDFIRDYLTMKKSSPVITRDVYDIFKRYAQENFLNKEEDLLEELRQFAEYYSWCKYCQSNNLKLNSLLRQFHDIKSFVAFPVLIWLFDKCYKQKTLSENELFDVIRTLLSYLYRRLICKLQYNFTLSTNSLNHTFAALPREIGDAKNVHEKILDILANKKRTTLFPRNDVFMTAFSSFDLYSTKLAKYTLTMLEQSLNTKERVELTDEITVEHIMPQTLSDAWRAYLGKDFEQIHSQWQHTVGNLTLTGNNSKIGNDIFADKRKVYVDSNIALSREVAKYENWNATTIQLRARHLFDKALIIWPLSENYNTSVGNTDIDYSAIYNITDDINVTSETPQSFFFDSKEYEVKTWADFFVGILRCLYEFDPATFEIFAQHETARRRHLAERSDSGHIFRKKTSGRQIVPGYNAETNASAQDLLSFARIAVELYGLEDYFSFKLQKNTNK
jgi:uncharacterized protein with ParB-like and HNH nuclease domain